MKKIPSNKRPGSNRILCIGHCGEQQVLTYKQKLIRTVDMMLLNNIFGFVLLVSEYAGLPN